MSIVSNPLRNARRWAHAAAIKIVALIAGRFRGLRATAITVATGIWWWWLEHGSCYRVLAMILESHLLLGRVLLTMGCPFCLLQFGLLNPNLVHDTKFFIPSRHIFHTSHICVHLTWQLHGGGAISWVLIGPHIHDPGHEQNDFTQWIGATTFFDTQPLFCFFSLCCQPLASSCFISLIAPFVHSTRMPGVQIPL